MCAELRRSLRSEVLCCIWQVSGPVFKSCPCSVRKLESSAVSRSCCCGALQQHPSSWGYLCNKLQRFLLFCFWILAVLSLFEDFSASPSLVCCFLAERRVIYDWPARDWQLWVTCPVTPLLYRTPPGFPVVGTLAALGTSRVSYWLDLHFMRRGKEIGVVEIGERKKLRLSGRAWGFCWADSDVQDVDQVLRVAQNSLLNLEVWRS